MVLELHIWGPGFGLPSIDASCLASIAYLRQCVPAGAWVLIPSNALNVNSAIELPALKDGDLWVSGYRSIVTYLSEISNADWSLDHQLDPQQSANCVAYTSFIESRGQPLLDLLFYVSSENYHSCTKSALGNILSWPNSWVIPNRLRERAKKRSEHLGLSSLDVDTIDEDKGQNEGFTAQIPASLRRPKQTISSILGRDVRKNRFRLDAVNSDFLEPLDEVLGQKQWLFNDQPSSADCLAVAVLTLMHAPTDLPHPWLKATIDGKHPSLSKWAHTHSASWFGVSSSKVSVLTKQRELPWQQPASRNWQNVLNDLVTTVTEAIPVVGSVFAARDIETSVNGKHISRHWQKQMALTRLHSQHLLHSQLLVSSLSLAAFTGVLLWNGLLMFPRRAPAPRPKSFGEAGKILGLG